MSLELLRVAIVASTLVSLAPVAHAQQEPSTVHLVTSNPRAQLQTLYEGRWRPVCDAPCDLQLDPALDYRIGGRGLRPTPRFRLEPGPLTLDARLASTTGLIVGASLTGVGGLLALTGGIDLLVGAYVSPNNCRFGPCSQADRDSWVTLWNTLGGVLVGVGVAMLIPGVIFVAGSSSTVDMHPGNTALRWTANGLSF